MHNFPDAISVLPAMIQPAGLHCAARPSLDAQSWRAGRGGIELERVLGDLEADHGERGTECMGHCVQLGFGRPSQNSMPVGQEHGRAIPLTDL